MCPPPDIESTDDLPLSARTTLPQPAAAVRRARGRDARRATAAAVCEPRFYCPVCKRRRAYELKRRPKRKPFPLSLLGQETPAEEVVCRLCSRCFPLSALAYDPVQARREQSAARERFTDAMQQAMAAMAIIDGRLTDNEVEAMRAVIAHVTGKDCCDEQLDAVLMKVRGRFDEVLAGLREVRGRLSEKRRHMILRAVLRVAAATTSIDPCERTLARHIGEALGLSPRTVRRLIEESEAKRR